MRYECLERLHGQYATETGTNYTWVDWRCGHLPFLPNPIKGPAADKDVMGAKPGLPKFLWRKGLTIAKAAGTMHGVGHGSMRGGVNLNLPGGTPTGRRAS